MPTRFLPYDLDQSLLLPPDIRDLLPEGHLVHYVSDLVDDLDLRELYAPYEGDGRRKSLHEPRMLLKVLRYGYVTGVFSSRGMTRKLEKERSLESEIGSLLQHVVAKDTAEDDGFGMEFRGDELPQELRRREDRLSTIRAVKVRLEARAREADETRGRRSGEKRNPRGG